MGYSDRISENSIVVRFHSQRLGAEAFFAVLARAVAGLDLVTPSLEFFRLFLDPSFFPLNVPKCYQSTGKHWYLASHESRLAKSKPVRTQKCGLGARNPSETRWLKPPLCTRKRVPPSICTS